VLRRGRRFACSGDNATYSEDGLMAYWQVGSGQEGRRSYSEECLRFGTAFAGAKYWTGGIGEVRRGDTAVLRYGARKFVAVGKVIEHDGEVNDCATEERKAWLKDFDGWDLPAYCYVEWHKAHRSEVARKQLPQSGFSRLKDAEYLEQARRIFDNNLVYPSNRNGPSTVQRFEDDESKDFLNQHLGDAATRRS
jgi:hypothetical protein